MSKRLKTYAGPHLTAAAGIAAPRAEHGGHAAVDLHIVEAVFTQASGKTTCEQERNRQREKEYSHVASSCGHHNQDVKQRKSPPIRKTKKHLECDESGGIITKAGLTFEMFFY